MRALILVALASCLPPAGTAEPANHEPTVTKRTDGDVTATKPIEGVEVHAAPLLFLGWSLVIGNNTDENVEIVWFQSSFVGSDRITYGALRKVVPGQIEGQVMISTIIPPHAIAGENVVAEKPIGNLHAAGVVTSSQVDDYRRQFQSIVTGGSFYLELNMHGTRRHWAGVLADTATPTAK